MTTWREQLDARISRCPSCDDWRFDGYCKACARRRDHAHDTREATFRLKVVAA